MKRKITDFFQSTKRVNTQPDNGEEALEVVVETVVNDTTEPSKKLESITASKSSQLENQPDALSINRDKDIDHDLSVPDYEDFAIKHGFDKQKWISSLSEEEKSLLELEIKYLHITWLTMLHKELTKPYFLKLKKFLNSQKSKTTFPSPNQIYSWSHYTPLPNLKCLILGQDPYHNFNQAHGLAFSVLEPTKPPPSLKNIYKTIQTDYPTFKIPQPGAHGGGGNLTKWAERGVLLLNTCLTVEAHKPNSHAKQGWETFTAQVINVAIDFHIEKQGFVVMAWGMPAQNTISNFKRLHQKEFLVIKTFHPSPFSAAKGFFTSQCFKLCNEWLKVNGQQAIDWSLLEGNSIF